MSQNVDEWAFRVDSCKPHFVPSVYHEITKKCCLHFFGGHLGVVAAILKYDI